MGDNHMGFWNKNQLVKRILFMLFIVALLVGLIAHWQVCIVAAIALIPYVILKIRSRRQDAYTRSKIF